MVSKEYILHPKSPRLSPSLQMKLYWPPLKQVRSVSTVQRGETLAHPGWGKIHKHRLYLLQTMSDFVVIRSTWGVFDQISKNVAPIKQKLPSCHAHCTEYFSPHSQDILLTSAIWFILNHLSSFSNMWWTHQCFFQLLGSPSRLSITLLNSTTHFHIIDNVGVSSPNVGTIAAKCSWASKFQWHSAVWWPQNAKIFLIFKRSHFN